MTVAVDTNILFDILLQDPKFVEQSLSQITLYGKKHRLIISEVVYSELASQFSEENILIKFISDTDISLVNSGPEALWKAARAWSTYTKNRTQEFQCKNCGNMQPMECTECNNSILSRQHILADFLIGGHALLHAGSLLTRDRGYYKRYFPELDLVP